MTRSSLFRVGIATSLAVSVLAGMAACGGGGSAGGGKGATDLGVPVPPEVVKAGVLSVGVRCDHPPTGSLDADGNHVGFDVDIAYRMAQYAFGDKNKIKFVCVTSDNRIPYLTSNRVDILAAGLSYTADRAKVVDFSDSYQTASTMVLTKADVPEFTNVDELNGKELLTLAGTPFADFVNKCLKGATVHEYKSEADAFTDLLNDRGFGLIETDSALFGLASKNTKVKINGPQLAIGYRTSIGVRKGDSAMLDWVNAGIAKMTSDDYFATLTKKYYAGDLQEELLKGNPRPNQKPDYSKYTGAPAC